MSETILFVDDEPQILDSMRRQLRKRFKINTALGGKEALKKIKSEGPFAVVVADMRMPGMDGVELLSLIKEISPDTVRLMLTGNADQQTAMEAVNKGQIFKFLTKPCPATILVPSLALALRQYRLITAEKELLDKTLKGSIKVLSELLSFSNPAAFSAGVRIRSLVMEIAEKLGYEDLWQLEIAALISQIGCVTLPAEIVSNIFTDTDLTDEEYEMYSNHPRIGAELLQKIPRMEDVAYIIENQLRSYAEFVEDQAEGDVRNQAAQIIKAAFDYNRLILQGLTHNDACRRLKQRKDQYNPEILNILKSLNTIGSGCEIVSLKIQDLTVGMIAEENIIAKNDTLLVPRGQEITGPVLQGIRNFKRQVGVKEPVQVRVNKKCETGTDID